jgi:predicted RNA-binding protein with PUA-like domain
MHSRRTWLYKWNGLGRFHEGKQRDWETVFDSVEEVPGFGFENAVGQKLLAEVAIGDIIVAYQTEQRAAIGICEICGVERTDSRPHVRFVPRRRFARPAKLHDLKKSNERLREVDALRQGPVQSFYRLTNEEARTVLVACGLTESEVSELVGG